MTTHTPEKICDECQEAWPADGEFFHLEPRNRDGLTNKCKACKAGYDRRRNGTAYRSKSGQLTQNLCGVFTALVTKQERMVRTGS